MKISTTLPTLTLCLAALTLVGCGGGDSSSSDEQSGDGVTGQDVQREMQQAAEAAGEYAAKTKDQAVAEARKQLDQLNEKMAEWQTKAAELSGEAKKKAEEKLAELKEQSKHLDEKWKQLKDVSAEAWASAQKEFAEAAGKASQSLKDLQSWFQSKTGDSASESTSGSGDNQ